MRKKSDSVADVVGFIIFFLVASLVAFGAVGYIKNVIKFAELDFKAPYKAEILRGIGIFPIAPMGMIEGYMQIPDGAPVEPVQQTAPVEQNEAPENINPVN